MDENIILNNSNFTACEIRGKVTYISNISEMKVGNNKKITIDDKFFIGVDMYRINNKNFNSWIGKVKVYIPLKKMTKSVNESVFYYISKKDNQLNFFKTAIPPNLINDRLFNKKISIYGNLKKDKNGKYTHFMNNIKKIVLLYDPN